MENQTVITLIELVMSILIGMSVLLVTHFGLTKIYQKRTEDDSPYKNTAYLIFVSGVMFSVSWLLSGIMEPLSSTLKLLFQAHDDGLTISLQYLKFLGLFIGIGMAIGALINVLSYYIFSSITRDIDEFKAIANGNIGIAIMTTVIVIVITMFCREYFLLFLESFIPYPEMPRLF
jgi:hypothetical protein